MTRKSKIKIEEVLDFISEQATKDNIDKIFATAKVRHKEIQQDIVSDLEIGQIVWIRMARRNNIINYGEFVQGVIRKKNPKTVILVVPIPTSVAPMRWKVSPSLILSKKPKDFEKRTNQDLKKLKEHMEQCREKEIPARWKPKSSRRRR